VACGRTTASTEAASFVNNCDGLRITSRIATTTSASKLPLSIWQSRATLQKDRLFGGGFPFYRVGRSILYDLDEVQALVRAGRVDGAIRRPA